MPNVVETEREDNKVQKKHRAHPKRNRPQSVCIWNVWDLRSWDSFTSKKNKIKIGQSKIFWTSCVYC